MLRLLTAVFLRAVLVMLAVTLASGCAKSQELTRTHANTLINNARDFKEPATVKLKDDYGEITVPAQSDDEKEAEAQPRAVAAFLDDHPALAVLQHLGLIDVTAQLIQKPQTVKAPEITVERPDGTEARSPVGRARLEPWKFAVRIGLTEKGKQAAGSDGRSIPLYTRRLVDVTGIVKSQDGRAQAEFRWQAVPTAVGEAFDPTSDEYKRLPTNLRQGLKKPTGLLQRTPLADTSEIDSSPKKGVAFFQRYDDGWRLTAIQ